MTRSIHLLWLLAAFWLGHLHAVEMAGDPAAELPQSRDLAADAAAARAAGIPLVLLVSQRECGFCQQMKERILYPTLRGGAYLGRVLFREVRMDADEPLRDWQGRPGAGDVFARGYGVTIAPTLLFLRPDGSEAAKRIIGLSGAPDLLFAYLDAALEQAIAVTAKER